MNLLSQMTRASMKAERENERPPLPDFQRLSQDVVVYKLRDAVHALGHAAHEMDRQCFYPPSQSTEIRRIANKLGEIQDKIIRL